MDKTDPAIMSQKSMEMFNLLKGISLKDSFSIFSMMMIMKGGMNWMDEAFPKKENIMDLIFRNKKKHSDKPPFDIIK